MISIIIAIIISLTTGTNVDSTVPKNSPNKTAELSNDQPITTLGGSGNWTEE